MVIETLHNLRVCVIHLYSRSRALTCLTSGAFRLEFPYSLQAVRIHIVRQKGELATQHPFLGHPWCVRDSDRGVAWGVLTAPSIADLLRLVRAQDVKEEIKCPRYLIGATGEGSTRLL